MASKELNDLMQASQKRLTSEFERMQEDSNFLLKQQFSQENDVPIDLIDNVDGDSGTVHFVDGSSLPFRLEGIDTLDMPNSVQGKNQMQKYGLTPGQQYAGEQLGKNAFSEILRDANLNGVTNTDIENMNYKEDAYGRTVINSNLQDELLARGAAVQDRYSGVESIADQKRRGLSIIAEQKGLGLYGPEYEGKIKPQGPGFVQEGTLGHSLLTAAGREAASKLGGANENFNTLNQQSFKEYGRSYQELMEEANDHTLGFYDDMKIKNDSIGGAVSASMYGIANRASKIWGGDAFGEQIRAIKWENPAIDLEEADKLRAEGKMSAGDYFTNLLKRGTYSFARSFGETAAGVLLMSIVGAATKSPALAMSAGSVFFAVGKTGDLIEQRTINLGGDRSKISAADYGVLGLAGLFTGFMEAGPTYFLGKIFGGMFTRAMSSFIAGKTTAKVFARELGALAGAMGFEFVQEGVQEGLDELARTYIGALNTPEWDKIDNDRAWKDAYYAGLEGAVAGLVGGGAFHTAGRVYQKSKDVISSPYNKLKGRLKDLRNKENAEEHKQRAGSIQQAAYNFRDKINNTTDPSDANPNAAPYYTNPNDMHSDEVDAVKTLRGILNTYKNIFKRETNRKDRQQDAQVKVKEALEVMKTSFQKIIEKIKNSSQVTDTSKKNKSINNYQKRIERIDKELEVLKDVNAAEAKAAEDSVPPNPKAHATLSDESSKLISIISDTDTAQQTPTEIGEEKTKDIKFKNEYAPEADQAIENLIKIYDEETGKTDQMSEPKQVQEAGWVVQSTKKAIANWISNLNSKAKQKSTDETIKRLNDLSDRLTNSYQKYVNKFKNDYHKVNRLAKAIKRENAASPETKAGKGKANKVDQDKILEEEKNKASSSQTPEVSVPVRDEDTIDDVEDTEDNVDNPDGEVVIEEEKEEELTDEEINKLAEDEEVVVSEEEKTNETEDEEVENESENLKEHERLIATEEEKLEQAFKALEKDDVESAKEALDEYTFNHFYDLYQEFGSSIIEEIREILEHQKAIAAASNTPINMEEFREKVQEFIDEFNVEDALPALLDAHKVAYLTINALTGKTKPTNQDRQDVIKRYFTSDTDMSPVITSAKTLLENHQRAYVEAMFEDITILSDVLNHLGAMTDEAIAKFNIISDIYTDETKNTKLADIFIQGKLNEFLAPVVENIMGTELVSSYLNRKGDVKTREFISGVILKYLLNRLYNSYAEKSLLEAKKAEIEILKERKYTEAEIAQIFDNKLETPIYTRKENERMEKAKRFYDDIWVGDISGLGSLTSYLRYKQFKKDKKTYSDGIIGELDKVLNKFVENKTFTEENIKDIRTALLTEMYDKLVTVVDRINSVDGRFRLINKINGLPYFGEITQTNLSEQLSKNNRKVDDIYVAEHAEETSEKEISEITAKLDEQIKKTNNKKKIKQLEDFKQFIKDIKNVPAYRLTVPDTEKVNDTILRIMTNSMLLAPMLKIVGEVKLTDVNSKTPAQILEDIKTSAVSGHLTKFLEIDGRNVFLDEVKTSKESMIDAFVKAVTAHTIAPLKKSYRWYTHRTEISAVGILNNTPFLNSMFKKHPELVYAMNLIIREQFNVGLAQIKKNNELLDKLKKNKKKDQKKIEELEKTIKAFDKNAQEEYQKLAEAFDKKVLAESAMLMNSTDKAKIENAISSLLGKKGDLDTAKRDLIRILDVNENIATAFTIIKSTFFTQGKTNAVDIDTIAKNMGLNLSKSKDAATAENLRKNGHLASYTYSNYGNMILKLLGIKTKMDSNHAAFAGSKRYATSAGMMLVNIMESEKLLHRTTDKAGVRLKIASKDKNTNIVHSNISKIFSDHLNKTNHVEKYLGMYFEPQKSSDYISDNNEIKEIFAGLSKTNQEGLNYFRTTQYFIRLSDLDIYRAIGDKFKYLHQVIEEMTLDPEIAKKIESDPSQNPANQFDWWTKNTENKGRFTANELLLLEGLGYKFIPEDYNDQTNKEFGGLNLIYLSSQRSRNIQISEGLIAISHLYDEMMTEVELRDKEIGITTSEEDKREFLSKMPLYSNFLATPSQNRLNTGQNTEIDIISNKMFRHLFTTRAASSSARGTLSRAFSYRKDSPKVDTSTITDRDLEEASYYAVAYNLGQKIDNMTLPESKAVGKFIFETLMKEFETKSAEDLLRELVKNGSKTFTVPDTYGEISGRDIKISIEGSVVSVYRLFRELKSKVNDPDGHTGVIGVTRMNEIDAAQSGLIIKGALYPNLVNRNVMVNGGIYNQIEWNDFRDGVQTEYRTNKDSIYYVPTFAEMNRGYFLNSKKEKISVSNNRTYMLNPKYPNKHYDNYEAAVVNLLSIVTNKTSFDSFVSSLAELTNIVKENKDGEIRVNSKLTNPEIAEIIKENIEERLVMYGLLKRVNGEIVRDESAIKDPKTGLVKKEVREAIKTIVQQAGIYGQAISNAVQKRGEDIFKEMFADIDNFKITEFLDDKGNVLTTELSKEGYVKWGDFLQFILDHKHQFREEVQPNRIDKLKHKKLNEKLRSQKKKPVKRKKVYKYHLPDDINNINQLAAFLIKGYYHTVVPLKVDGETSVNIARNEITHDIDKSDKSIRTYNAVKHSIHLRTLAEDFSNIVKGNNVEKLFEKAIKNTLGENLFVFNNATNSLENARFDGFMLAFRESMNEKIYEAKKTKKVLTNNEVVNLIKSVLTTVGFVRYGTKTNHVVEQFIAKFQSTTNPLYYESLNEPTRYNTFNKKIPKIVDLIQARLNSVQIADSYQNLNKSVEYISGGIAFANEPGGAGAVLDIHQFDSMAISNAVVRSLVDVIPVHDAVNFDSLNYSNMRDGYNGAFKELVNDRGAMSAKMKSARNLARYLADMVMKNMMNVATSTSGRGTLTNETLLLLLGPKEFQRIVKALKNANPKFDTYIMEGPTSGNRVNSTTLLEDDLKKIFVAHGQTNGHFFTGYSNLNTYGDYVYDGLINFLFQSMPYTMSRTELNHRSLAELVLDIDTSIEIGFREKIKITDDTNVNIFNINSTPALEKNAKLVKEVEIAQATIEDLLTYLNNLSDIRDDVFASGINRDVIMQTFISVLKQVNVILPDGLKVKFYETTKEHASYNPKANTISIGLAKNTSAKTSVIEALTEEIVHSALEAAFSLHTTEAQSFRKRLFQVWKQAREQITPEMLGQGKEGRKLWNYMFGKADIEHYKEFIANGLTNNDVMGVFGGILVNDSLSKMTLEYAQKAEEAVKQRGLLGAIVEMFKALFRLFNPKNYSNMRNLDVYSSLSALFMTYAKLSRMTTNKSGLRTWDRMMFIKDSVDQLINNGFERTPLKTGATNTLATYLRDRFNIKEDSWGLRLLRVMSRESDPVRVVNMAIMANKKIDTDRQIKLGQAYKAIRSSFKTELNDIERKALNDYILRLDAAALHRYSDTQLKSLLTDTEARKAEIKRIIAKLHSDIKSSDNIVSRIVKEAKVLAKFMNTNKLEQKYTMPNAMAIYKRVDSLHKIKHNEKVTDKNTIYDIDRLVTLYALDLTPVSYLDNVIENDIDGIRGIMTIHREISKGYSDNQNNINHIKGWLNDELNTQTHIKYEVAYDTDKLERKGWIKEESIGSIDSTLGPVMVYRMINYDALPEQYNQGAMRITNAIRNVPSIGGVVNNFNNRIVSPDRAIISKKAAIESIAKGKFSAKDGTSILPVYWMNSKGELTITDGRIVTPYEVQEKNRFYKNDVYMKLAENYAHTIDIERSDKANKELVDMHMGFYRQEIATPRRTKNIAELKRVQKEWIKVSNKDNVALWDRLPAYTKHHIMEKYNGVFYVRKDAQFGIFGNEAFSFSDWLSDNGIIGKDLYKQMKLIGHGIQFAVSKLKQYIILATPAVLLYNSISNFVVLASYGLQKGIIFKTYEAIKQYKQYKNLFHEVAYLDTQILITAKKDESKRLKQKRDMLKAEMESLPISQLLDQGFGVSIVAELDEEVTTKSATRFGERVEKIRDKFEENYKPFSKVMENMLFTNRSEVNRFMREATMLSDLVARYIAYTNLMNRQVGIYVDTNGRHPNFAEMEKMKLEAKHQAMDLFVNYELPDSKGIDYLNRMGVLMFTKYWSRIARVIAAGIKTHPTSFASAMGLYWYGYGLSAPLNSVGLPTFGIDMAGTVDNIPMFHFIDGLIPN
jgi:hypothetical protein